MTIKKFIAKTEEEATAKAKQELGASCVIMNIRQIKPTGFLKAFKSSTYEVTAAIEEKEYKMNGNQNIKNPFSAENTGKINLSANEDIHAILKETPSDSTMSQKAGSTYQKMRPQSHEGKNMDGFEERLENLQNMLEERLAPVPQKADIQEMEEEQTGKPVMQETDVKVLKMIYNTLLDNEVNERYANLLIDEIDRSSNKSASVDMLLANVYQKMILKFGQPCTIELSGKKPKVIFFIGPTGVGKTTTIAKIASKLKVEGGKKISLLTADTYRIAAEEQLRTYANILDTPLTIIYEPEELPQAIQKVKDADVVLVDTAGFSHKSVQQKEDTKNLIQALPESYQKEVYLVLSATTKYRDLIEIADSYKDIANYKMIFTKLDETSAYGNLFNMRMYTQAEMSYVTNGQNVPDDIDVFNTQAVVKKLLGGK
ncbi:MAG: flagellar biosynthesis protein FlhF [Lachnospiraceae bacterium]